MSAKPKEFMKTVAVATAIAQFFILLSWVLLFNSSL